MQVAPTPVDPLQGLGELVMPLRHPRAALAGSGEPTTVQRGQFLDQRPVLGPARRQGAAQLVALGQPAHPLHQLPAAPHRRWWPCRSTGWGWSVCGGRAPGTDQAFQQARFGWPGFEEDRSWYLAGGVAQCEGDDDDVVEWSDDGQELGDEVDG